MRKFVGLCLLLVIVFQAAGTFAQSDKDLIANLKSSDFTQVLKARDSLLALEKQSVPLLIKLLGDTSRVRLTHTADLMYPGFTSIGLHGWMVPYGLDIIALRAAWILEEITLQDFGYAASSTSILGYHHRGNFEDLMFLKSFVENGWEHVGLGWQRRDAIVSALSS